MEIKGKYGTYQVQWRQLGCFASIEIYEECKFLWLLKYKAKVWDNNWGPGYLHTAWEAKGKNREETAECFEKEVTRYEECYLKDWTYNE